MAKCKNCKHFKKTGDFSGDCSNEKFVIGYHSAFVDYDNVEKRGETFIKIPPDGVMIEDDEGWGFLVGEDFGCIHFEAQNATIKNP